MMSLVIGMPVRRGGAIGEKRGDETHTTTPIVNGRDFRKGEDDDMVVLAIAAGSLVTIWIFVLWGSRYLGPR